MATIYCVGLTGGFSFSFRLQFIPTCAFIATGGDQGLQRNAGKSFLMKYINQSPFEIKDHNMVDGT